MARRAPRPARLEELAAEARNLCMGEVGRHKLLQCVMAVRGLDVTRRLDDQGGRDVGADELARALPEAAEALGRALRFLRGPARIPHLRLLPYPVPLIVLTRFFHLHPDPGPRSRRLLVRWVWRGMFTGAHEHRERTARRRAVHGIGGDEEASVQALLALVPRRRPVEERVAVRGRFDARAAASRIAALALAHLGPRDPLSGHETDVARLFEERGVEAFARWLPTGAGDLGSGIANRVLVEGVDRGARLRRGEDDPEVLRSHAIDEAAVEALCRGHRSAAIAARARAIERELSRLEARTCEWDRPDRPSIDYLLRDTGPVPAG